MASQTFKLTLHAYLSLDMMLGIIVVNLPHASQVPPVFHLESSFGKVCGLHNDP